MIDEKVNVVVLFELLDFEAYFSSTEPEVFAFIHSEHIHQNTTPCQVFPCNSPSRQSPNDLSVTLSIEQKNETGHTSHLASGRLVTFYMPFDRI